MQNDAYLQELLSKVQRIEDIVLKLSQDLESIKETQLNMKLTLKKIKNNI